MRTTSSIEGLNSVIQRSFPSRTTIFKFVESLKLHEATKSTDLYQISEGQVTNPQLERRRESDRQREQKIKVVTNALHAGDISVSEFLVAMYEEDDILAFDGTFNFFN